MSRIKTFLIVTSFAVAAAGPVSAKEKIPELSPAELSVVQTKTFDAPFAVVMSSSVAALQSAGYLDITASKDAGTVSGHTDAKSKLMFNIFWGLGKKKYTQTAQFLIEELRPGQTTVRLNMFLNESKTRSIVFGSRMTDALIIKQGDPYRSMLALVADEVKRRQPEVAPTSPPTPTSTAPAAGTGAVNCVTCQ